jgi:lipopolysaccharide transport system ATP-binding protein
MPRTVIKVDGVGKEYFIGAREGGTENFREMLTSALAAPFRRLKQLHGSGTVADERIWALKDVSFEVHEGEVIGIIGRNGAGKSTLLKILSRITAPTKGRVEIRGRVSSLLEIGTGFHPELTGRENIYLNGAILGMSRSEIRAKFDQIVDFSGVEKFLDTPVKRYSSGMQVRLAFAVAAHLEPEILIVDEVLAVGDAEFQKKCLGKMHDVAGEGRTVLFVSHSMPSVQQLCSSGMVLSRGIVEFQGSIDQTIARYVGSFQRVTQQSLRARRDRSGDGKLRIVDVTLHDQDGTEVGAVICGQPLRLRLHYESVYGGAERSLHVAVGLRNTFGGQVAYFENTQTGAACMPVHPAGYFECFLPKVTLRSATYFSTIKVSLEGLTSDWITDGFQLDIEDGDFFGSGKLGPRDESDIVIDQSWSSIRCPGAPSDAPQER